MLPVSAGGVPVAALPVTQLGDSLGAEDIALPDPDGALGEEPQAAVAAKASPLPAKNTAARVLRPRVRGFRSILPLPSWYLGMALSILKTSQTTSEICPCQYDYRVTIPCGTTGVGMYIVGTVCI